MRTVKWNAFLSGLCGFAGVLGVAAAGAHADVTIEKGASILVYPRVLATDLADTVIQLANTGNSMVHVKCYYVNASLVSTITFAPCDTPSATCTPLWQETDFNIWLTKQQPTHWLVSSGRRVDPTDGFGSDGSGFDPGLVPPVFDFEGELKCIEVTESDEPVTGNHIKGEATLVATGFDDALFGTDVSKYNAIGIIGNPDVQPTNPLLLDGQVYDACPSKLILNHFATLAEDPVVTELNDRLERVYDSKQTYQLSVQSSVFTNLTLVPCSEDFENQQPTSSTIQFVVYNEFEERFSASTTVTCYLSVELTDIDSPTTFERSIFSVGVLGTTVGHAEITPIQGVPGGPTRGVIGVAERFVAAAVFEDSSFEGEDFASAAYNLHSEGDLIPAVGGPDSIRLTEHE
jgi:hypothetical protein